MRWRPVSVSIVSMNRLAFVVLCLFVGCDNARTERDAIHSIDDCTVDIWYRPTSEVDIPPFRDPACKLRRDIKDDAWHAVVAERPLLQKAFDASFQGEMELIVLHLPVGMFPAQCGPTWTEASDTKMESMSTRPSPIGGIMRRLHRRAISCLDAGPNIYLHADGGAFGLLIRATRPREPASARAH